MPKKKADIRVGISGWTYPGWRGSFYPKGLVQKEELNYASRKVNAIEINGTFYSMQKPHTFKSWFEQTPDNFIFAIKGGQFLTHVLRLKGDYLQGALANFCASGLLALQHKLGPILWQFPPFVTLKDDRFEKFIDLLPKNQNEMSDIAKEHTAKVAGNTYFDVHQNITVRHAFEFRHKSFENKDFIAMLREKNVAFVFAQSGKEKAAYTEDVTSNFIYARMHGIGKQFKKGYSEADQQAWSEKIKTWSKGKTPDPSLCILKPDDKNQSRDIFVFYDNDEKVFAPRNALELMKLLGISDQMQSTSKDKASFSRKKIAKSHRKKKTPSQRTKKKMPTQSGTKKRASR